MCKEDKKWNVIKLYALCLFKTGSLYDRYYLKKGEKLNQSSESQTSKYMKIVSRKRYADEFFMYFLTKVNAWISKLFF